KGRPGLRLRAHALHSLAPFLGLAGASPAGAGSEVCGCGGGAGVLPGSVGAGAPVGAGFTGTFGVGALGAGAFVFGSALVPCWGAAFSDAPCFGSASVSPGSAGSSAAPDGSVSL